MVEIIIVSLFLFAILYILISSIFEYGFSTDTFKTMLNKIVMCRGLFFLIFFIYMCIKMMSMVENSDKYAFIPFILCGFAAMLSMYAKTRKLGFYLFAIIFIGSFFIVFPTLALINEYNNYGSVNSLMSYIIFYVIGIILTFIIFKTLNNKDS